MNQYNSTETEQEWVARRETRFAALERLLGTPPPYTEAEVEADIAEAIAAVRSERTMKRVEGEIPGS